MWAERVAKKYPKGLFVAMAASVLGYAKNLSLGRWLVRRLTSDRAPHDGKLPAALGDLYQIACLTCVTVLTQVWPLNTPRSGLAAAGAGVALIYRTFEISAILAAWIFVDTARLHSYRRSIIGFTLNAIEIGLIAAGLSLWFNCSGSTSNAWQQFVAVLTVSADGGGGASLVCTAIPATRFVVSAGLVLLVLATLAGGLIRKEITSVRPNNRLQPPAAEKLAAGDVRRR